MMGVSVIVRDHVRQLMATMSSPLLFIINPKVAEVMAARKAVVFGRNLGTKNIILEGDGLEIVHVIQKNDHS